MLQIIYKSKATVPFVQPELQALLRIAQTHNRSKGITGMLVYHNHCFLQLLEGEEQDVLALMAHIAEDRRHHQVKIVAQDNITVRAYDGWAMGFVDTADPRACAYTGFQSACMDLDVLALNATRAKIVLDSFRAFVPRDGQNESV